MFHLFQNQLFGLSAGNTENTPNNNAMLNHFQTNLGIGPRSLLSQIQSNQCAMQSINAPIGQVALLQAQHTAAQNNPTTLQSNPPPLLELTAAQRGTLAAQQAETSSSLFQHVHSNSAPTGQVQFNLPLSSRTTVGQDQLDPLSLSLSWIKQLRRRGTILSGRTVLCKWVLTNQTMIQTMIHQN